jgi:hypothetical protein
VRVPPPFPDPPPPGLPPEIGWGVSWMVPHPLAPMTRPLHLAHGETDLPAEAAGQLCGCRTKS